MSKRAARTFRRARSCCERAHPLQETARVRRQAPCRRTNLNRSRREPAEEESLAGSGPPRTSRATDLFPTRPGPSPDPTAPPPDAGPEPPPAPQAASAGPPPPRAERSPKPAGRPPERTRRSQGPRPRPRARRPGQPHAPPSAPQVPSPLPPPHRHVHPPARAHRPQAWSLKRPHASPHQPGYPHPRRTAPMTRPAPREYLNQPKRTCAPLADAAGWKPQKKFAGSATDRAHCAEHHGPHQEQEQRGAAWRAFPPPAAHPPTPPHPTTAPHGRPPHAACCDQKQRRPERRERHARSRPRPAPSKQRSSRHPRKRGNPRHDEQTAQQTRTRRDSVPLPRTPTHRYPHPPCLPEPLPLVGLSQVNSKPPRTRIGPTHHKKRQDDQRGLKGSGHTHNHGPKKSCPPATTSVLCSTSALGHVVPRSPSAPMRMRRRIAAPPRRVKLA